MAHQGCVCDASRLCGVVADEGWVVGVQRQPAAIPFPLRWRHWSQLVRRSVKRFRGGLTFKAHRLWYDSTLGLTIIKKKKGRGMLHRSEGMFVCVTRDGCEGWCLRDMGRGVRVVEREREREREDTNDANPTAHGTH